MTDPQHGPAVRRDAVRITHAYSCNGDPRGRCEGKRFGGCDYCDGTDNMGRLFNQILSEQVDDLRAER